MPTISQLPSAGTITAADLLPLSQQGETRAASVGALLAGTQPAITAPFSTLLGRVSVGPGGPEAVAVGSGLALNGGTLAATGTDHSAFPTHQSFASADMLVASIGGQPGLLPVASLRALFSAGSDISIDPLGVISATGTGGAAQPIASLPVVTSAGSRDLLSVSQNGTACAITLANLLNGETIDMAEAATPPSDGDTFWVAQGTSTMCRQSLGALWPWLAAKLPTYKSPVVEITTATTLDGTVHNNRILLCTSPVTLSAAPMNMGSGFQCDVINLSSGDVVLASGIATSSGESVLAAGQCMRLYVANYSAGVLVYAWLGNPSGSVVSPGQVTSLTVTDETSSSVSLDWSAPSSGGAVAGYTVKCRPSGATTWAIVATDISSTQYTVSGLSASTAYEFMVVATNGALSGPASDPVTCSTNSATVAAPAKLSATNVTATSVTLSWSAPSTGGAQSYSIQYRTTGNSDWTDKASGITATAYTVSDLQPGQSYDWCVTAIAADGSSAVSTVITVVTLPGGGAVTALTWNAVPTGPLTSGSGSIGINAHVTPASAAVQFGLSMSATTPPPSWTAATCVNTDLWGAYLPTPTTAGTWYAWAEGIDGSMPTVYPTGIVVT